MLGMKKIRRFHLLFHHKLMFACHPMFAVKLDAQGNGITI